MRPITAEDFSTLVGSIYECALDPARWPATLAVLRREMDFANASLDVFDVAAGRVVLNVINGIDMARLDDLKAHGFQMVEQWGGAERVQRLPLDEPLLLSQINPSGLTRGNRFYEHFDEPEGIIDVMTIRLARNKEGISSIAFGRHRDQGPVGDGEVALAALFVPHLKRALAICRLLEERTVESASYAGVLDGLSVAVLLVAPDLRLVHANRQGEALLRTGDPLGLRHGRVTALASIAGALSVALAAPRSGIGRRGLGIPARRSDGDALVLHVLPLANGGLLPAASAAIFVAPAVAPPPAPIAAVAALFDLTPTEARVLALIGKGSTTAEIAEAMAIAPSTVKTHLQRLFDKTRTHRQADLVGLLASFSLPLA